jgi:hypothetical protein
LLPKAIPKTQAKAGMVETAPEIKKLFIILNIGCII